MELTDARFWGYKEKGKAPLNLGFKAPNLAPAFSSTLLIVWCGKFAERSKPSVSALYGAGRRPVLGLPWKSVRPILVLRWGWWAVFLHGRLSWAPPSCILNSPPDWLKFVAAILDLKNNRVYCSRNNSLLSFSSPDWLRPLWASYSSQNNPTDPSHRWFDRDLSTRLRIQAVGFCSWKPPRSG